MAPVVPFLGLIGTVLTVAGGITTAVMSNKQADKAAKRQQDYLNQLQQQQEVTEAEEKRLTDEANQRNKAYSASLLQSNSQLDNILSGGWDDENQDNSNTLLSNTLQPMNVQQIFA